MIVWRKFSREFINANENLTPMTSSLPKQGGLGWVSFLNREGWGGSLVPWHPCDTRDTLVRRVPALYTKAMWHPCTLKSKFRAHARKNLHPSSFILETRQRCPLTVSDCNKMGSLLCKCLFLRQFYLQLIISALYLCAVLLNKTDKPCNSSY